MSDWTVSVSIDGEAMNPVWHGPESKAWNVFYSEMNTITGTEYEGCSVTLFNAAGEVEAKASNTGQKEIDVIRAVVEGNRIAGNAPFSGLTSAEIGRYNRFLMYGD